MTAQPAPASEVRTERTFAAPAHSVYRAWLDPELVRLWLAPGTQEVIRAEIDERPGGAYRTWKADDGVVVGGFDSEITELVPDRRLVFRWGFIGPQRRQGPSFDTLLTVTFDPEPGGGTTVRLTHEQLGELAAAMPEVAAHVGAGWDAVLEKCAGVLAGDIPRPDTGVLAGELDHPGAQQLLRTATLARLAYTGPDGFPRVIPIGFHWDGGNVIVCTVPSSPKVRALAARPHTALTIDTDEGTASRALSIRGVAAVEIVDGVPAEYLAAATKGMDTGQARQFEANVRALYEQMARITIQPRWARYYDFGTGRLPGFLDKLIKEHAGAQI
jgi:uncharacterized protein YndB with AHSA1/START domain